MLRWQVSPLDTAKPEAEEGAEEEEEEDEETEQEYAEDELWQLRAVTPARRLPLPVVKHVPTSTRTR